MKNKQIGGSHYKKGIQPFEYIDANNMDFFEGNVIKYVTRHKEKNGLEDLDKAIHYIEEIKARHYGKKQPDEKECVANLVAEIKANETKKYTRIVTIGRGGLWAAAQIAYQLDIPHVETYPLDQLNQFSDDHTLFVDGIVDSGDTIRSLIIDSAALYVRYSTGVWPSYVGHVVHHDHYVDLPISQPFDTKGKDA